LTRGNTRWFEVQSNGKEVNGFIANFSDNNDNLVFIFYKNGSVARLEHFSNTMAASVQILTDEESRPYSGIINGTILFGNYYGEFAWVVEENNIYKLGFDNNDDLAKSNIVIDLNQVNNMKGIQQHIDFHSITSIFGSPHSNKKYKYVIGANGSSVTFLINNVTGVYSLISEKLTDIAKDYFFLGSEIYLSYDGVLVLDYNNQKQKKILRVKDIASLSSTPISRLYIISDSNDIYILGHTSEMGVGRWEINPVDIRIKNPELAQPWVRRSDRITRVKRAI